MSGEKKYRRTKRIIEHANPLFDSWLLEWQQEAEKRGSNMKYNFQRARKSLSRYPLPLCTGQDCKLLANFGNKICQMLDRRLAQHEEEFGTIDWAQVHKIRETSRNRRKKKADAPTVVAIPTTPVMAGDKNRKLYTTQSLRKSDNEEDQSKNRSKNKRQYIPMVRSAAYAMLMALHQASLLQHYPGHMKKEELVAAAQPHCNVSLSKPDKVGSYYTGWASMKTLVKKGLVLRQSHPHRFSITEEGKILALKLERAERSIDLMDCVDPPAAASLDIGTADEQPPSCHIPTHTLSSSDNEDDDNDSKDVREDVEEEEEEHGAWKHGGGMVFSSCHVSHNMSHLGLGHHPALKSCANPLGGVSFSYVTTLGMETSLKDCAEVTVEEDGFLGFLIKCSALDLQESGLHCRLHHARSAPAGFVYAYLSNECAPDQCLGLNRADAQPPGPPPVTATSKQPRTKPQTNFLSQLPSGSDATVSPPLNEVNIKRPISVSHAPAPPVAASPALPYMPFILRPEDYEIILCIDVAETSGKSSGVQPSNKDVILSELRRNGVKYSIRKLHVGDYLWVCQKTCPSLATSREISSKETGELVLPVVVERKRMDDLAASIKDGRFREQKFRLRQCGLNHPVYLVEEDRGSVVAGLSLPEMTCLQAVVNTQVINGFTVKVVKDQRESAAYLTIMTRYLQNRYQNKTVSSAQLQDLNESQTSLTSKIETSLLPFTEFNTASMKNQQLAVREMFAKHLLQLYGISADKALAVVDKYGTPSLLMAAFKEEGSPDEAKKLLAGLRWGKTGRSLGPVLSTSIASLYTTPILH